METKDLESALKLAQPCLLGVDFIPVLSHFCFDDGLVYAYDGVAATIVSCETDLRGAVRGDMLLGVVGLAGPTITLKQEKDKVVVSSGRSRVELPCLQSSDFMFQFPEQEAKTQFALTEVTIKGLALCSSGVGNDPRKPEFTGVTLQLGKDAVFYASDNTSLTRYETKETVGKKQLTVIVPKSVCDQILAVGSALEVEWGKVSVTVTEEFITIQFDETTPNVTIVGKLLAVKPAQFEKAVAAHETNKPRFKIPEAFDKAVAKVALVISKEPQKDCVLITHKEVFTVSGQGDLGVAETKFDTDHAVLPDVTATCSPEHLTKILADVTHLIVDERVVQMQGDRLTYYIATRA
jgi:hypothetical protein